VKALQYRTFGRTGWRVSEIGLGAWQVGGRWGKVDDDESIRALLYAFDQGVNYVDTAQSYGNGHSEEIVGKALRQ
jgi:aryl-alcohol dehydrogenase-like predicted oxidoreductase